MQEGQMYAALGVQHKFPHWDNKSISYLIFTKKKKKSLLPLANKYNQMNIFYYRIKFHKNKQQKVIALPNLVI